MKFSYADSQRLLKARKRAGEIVLKPKEIEFLNFCCQDIPYREIARKMRKSPRTIDGYRDTLLYLLEVRSRTGLVLWCLKSGFLKVKDVHLTTHRKKKSPAKNSGATNT